MREFVPLKFATSRKFNISSCKKEKKMFLQMRISVLKLFYLLSHRMLLSFTYIYIVFRRMQHSLRRSRCRHIDDPNRELMKIQQLSFIEFWSFLEFPSFLPTSFKFVSAVCSVPNFIMDFPDFPMQRSLLRFLTIVSVFPLVRSQN